MKIAFTICNRDQLTNALCLGQSLIEHNPHYTFVIGWVDAAPLADLPVWVKLLRVDSLGIKSWERMAEIYFEHELMAASKPFIIRALSNSFPEFEEILFLSPTTFILAPINSVIDPDSFIQLTPNRVSPIDESKFGVLDDKKILNIGMYNHGALVIHPSFQLNTLLDWWENRAMNRQFLDLCNGMAMDQLWLNYFPIYFQGVSIIRNWGWHFGLHAAIGAMVSKDNGEYLVNGQPLISVEFAGIKDSHPIWSDHGSLLNSDKIWEGLIEAYDKNCRDYRFTVIGNTYGKRKIIKRHSYLRKRVIKALSSMITTIEQFDLTHN